MSARSWKRDKRGWIECDRWRITHTANVPCPYLLWDLTQRPNHRLVGGYLTEAEARMAAREREQVAA